jgi:hypothetical protein
MAKRSEVLDIELGSSGGPPRFFSSAPPLTALEVLKRRPPRAFAEVAIQRNALVAKGPRLPTGLACHGGLKGNFVVDGAGALSLDGAALAAAPKDFIARRSIHMGSDDAGRVLLTGGVASNLKARKTDTWLFDGHALLRLDTKGKAPSSGDGQVVYDPARKVWLLVGGRRGIGESASTCELDERTLEWSSHESRFSDEKKLKTLGVALAMRDSTSGQLLAARWTNGITLRIYTYRGGGNWELLRESAHEAKDRRFYLPDGIGMGSFEITSEDEGIEPLDCIEGLAAFAWEDRSRVVWGASERALVAFDLGPFLEAALSSRAKKTTTRASKSRASNSKKSAGKKGS